MPQPGWNLFAYSINATRPVTEALASIAGSYTTVYGYVASDIQDPWKVYDVDAPAWVNDLNRLAFGQGYWIHVTEPVTLYLKGSASTQTLSAPAAQQVFSAPPATYYGTLTPHKEFVPTAGLPVRALVQGTLCGQSQTQLINGEVVFAVHVAAEADGRSGCGLAGRAVQVEIGGRVLTPTVAWDNQRVWRVALRALQSIYLPLIRR